MVPWPMSIAAAPGSWLPDKFGISWQLNLVNA